MHRNSRPSTFSRRWRLAIKMMFAALFLCGFFSAVGAAELSAVKRFSHGKFALDAGDVVAFVGGTDVVAAQFTGHLEALLTANNRGLGLRFRNFGWEGDTVFAQPRDINFPALKTLLARENTSVIVLRFGRMESLDGLANLPRFIAAYEKLLDECIGQTSRLVLVTPPPFEKMIGNIINPSSRNADLAGYAKAIRDLAEKRDLPLVDLFAEFHRRFFVKRLTGDGLQLTPGGHALVAGTFARQLGFGKIADRAGKANVNGSWSNAGFESLRKAITEKNQLWFHYYRPQNWAFLGGDRVEQPSSRDHRDLNVRWFPQEMEKFLPLIAAKEKEIEQLAAKLR